MVKKCIKKIKNGEGNYMKEYIKKHISDNEILINVLLNNDYVYKLKKPLRRSIKTLKVDWTINEIQKILVCMETIEEILKRSITLVAYNKHVRYIIYNEGKYNFNLNKKGYKLCISVKNEKKQSI